MGHDHGKGPVDLAVVGAGIVGCAVAREAARAGARVLLFDRDPAPASEVHAGWVAAQHDADAPDALFDLRMRGRTAFPAWLAGLEEETGLHVARRTAGVILPARSLAELEVLHGRATWQRRLALRFESLTGGSAREREAGLAEDLVAALHLPEDTGVDAAALHGALLIGAVEAGVELHLATPVLGLTREGGHLTGLHIPEGAVAAGAVILCAGAWSGTGGLPSAPVEPRRIVGLHLGQSRALRHGLWHPEVRISPLPDGRVLLTGAPEAAGFDTRVPAGRLGTLVRVAAELVPGLAELPVTGWGARLASSTADGLPLLGSTDAVNLIYAAGFGEHALTVAPAVALALVEYLQMGQAAPDLAPFSPLRFAA